MEIVENNSANMISLREFTALMFSFSLRESRKYYFSSNTFRIADWFFVVSRHR